MTEQGHLFPLDTDEKNKSLYNGRYYMKLPHELGDEVYEARKLSVDIGARAGSLARLEEAKRDIVTAIDKHRNPNNVNKDLYKTRALSLDRIAFEHFKEAWGYPSMIEHSDESVLGIEKALIEDYEAYLLRQKESVREKVDKWLVEVGARPSFRPNSPDRTEEPKPWESKDARERAAGDY